MNSYVFNLSDVDGTDVMSVGGKGANLGELSKLPGLFIPSGICMSTKAFERITSETRSLPNLLSRLSLLRLDERIAIRDLSTDIRELIQAIAIPQDIQMEFSRHLSTLGERDAYAVRSSATAEDLPMAYFAGQQDTYLNVSGIKAILEHINRCWASLYTERAVTYRIQNGLGSIDI